MCPDLRSSLTSAFSAIDQAALGARHWSRRADDDGLTGADDPRATEQIVAGNVERERECDDDAVIGRAIPEF